MTSRASRTALAIAFVLSSPAALAQREGYAYLSWVGPEVTLVSTAEDDTTARPNTPILAGDRISTGSSSRVEAILADGNVLRIDVQSSLRFDRLAKTYESEDTRNAVFLERGALSLEHRWSTSRDEATRIDTDDATIVFPDKGLVRVETGRRGTEIYVASGRAEVHARSGKATLRAGEYAYAAGDAELEVDRLEEPRDRFTRFVEERRDLASGRAGGGYVSAEYEYDYAVADFDRHGSWVSIGGSSYWRPTVSAGWRPYVDGYWRWSPAGLTWVSYEPWGWLPYHYGSWIWDVGFGWCWTPGVRYSPAWVYWSYTPSWVGWCPIGYYGSYWGGHHGGSWDRGDRSGRNRRGAERWTHAYPHLRGRVDVSRVDPRGWSYVSVSRIGSRFDARRDVLGQDGVRFREGERGLVATTPLRIDRGRGPAATAVQDAVRRVPQTVGASPRGGGGGLDDLTPILRREGTLGATEREGLRRAFVNPGEDPAYRPVSAEQLAAPRRETPGGPTASAPARGGERGLGSTSSPAPAPREGWRDGGTAGDARGTREPGAAPRRAETEPPLRGGFGRDGDVRGDDGWRSPGSETRGGSTPSRTIDVPSRRQGSGIETGEAPSRTGARATAPEPEPWREPSRPTLSRERPAVPDSGSSSPSRREAPAPRRDEGWRGGDAPSRPAEAPRPAPAPRSEAPPSRSSETPSRSYEAPPSRRSYDAPSRSYEAPRSAPAPRYEAPPSRRSYDAPSRTYEAPRSAPAPRYEAPPRSSSGSSSGSSSRSSGSSPRSSGSSSGSGDSPRSRSASPRG